MEHVPGLGSTGLQPLIRLGAQAEGGSACGCLARGKRDRSVSHPGPPLEASRECWEIHAERRSSTVRAAVVIALVSMEKALFPILPVKTSTSFPHRSHIRDTGSVRIRIGLPALFPQQGTALSLLHWASDWCE